MQFSGKFVYQQKSRCCSLLHVCPSCSKM